MNCSHTFEPAIYIVGTIKFQILNYKISLLHIYLTIGQLKSKSYIAVDKL